MAEDPADVERGLTLSGAQLCEAILRRHKKVENRKFSMRRGWYALHVGQKVHPILQRKDHQRVKREPWWKNFPKEESLPHSAIVGLFHVREATPLKALPDWRSDIWAVGPVCNVIDDVIRLEPPILGVGGALGPWDLPERIRVKIRSMLAEGARERNAASPVRAQRAEHEQLSRSPAASHLQQCIDLTSDTPRASARVGVVDLDTPTPRLVDDIAGVEDAALRTRRKTPRFGALKGGREYELGTPSMADDERWWSVLEDGDDPPEKRRRVG